MLTPEIISQMQLSDEQKAAFHNGETAEALVNSHAWQLILDWSEQRCNKRLAALHTARYASPEVTKALTDRWHDDEMFLRDLQLFIRGLIEDRDALINDFSRVVTDMRSRDIPGITEENSVPTEHSN